MTTYIKDGAGVQVSPAEAPSPKSLAELNKVRFTADGKEERIARSLAALNPRPASTYHQKTGSE